MASKGPRPKLEHETRARRQKVIVLEVFIGLFYALLCCSSSCWCHHVHIAHM